METKIEIGNYRLKKTGKNWNIEELITTGNPVMGHTTWKAKGAFPDPESAARGFFAKCLGTESEPAFKELIEGIIAAQK